MAADALVSVGVVIAGLAITWSGWLWLDPAVSLVISVVIVFGTWELLRDSVNLAVAAVPAGINAQEVLHYLKNLKGVTAVHDLHIWAMSTTETALTVHLVMPEGHPGDDFYTELCMEMRSKFRIQHATVQIEVGDSENRCFLESDEVV
jgi:cobalt-zinc-cadmium efflux system protein